MKPGKGSRLDDIFLHVVSQFRVDWLSVEFELVMAECSLQSSSDDNDLNGSIKNVEAERTPVPFFSDELSWYCLFYFIYIQQLTGHY